MNFLTTLSKMLALKSSRTLTVKVEAAAKIKVGINGEASRLSPDSSSKISHLEYLVQAMAELVDWSIGEILIIIVARLHVDET